jgi:hypothetical protein
MAVATYQGSLDTYEVSQEEIGGQRPVYTIGFSFWKRKDWYKALKSVKVNLIYDVRRVNVGYFRKEFGKKALEEKATEKMRYTSDVDLGPPKQLREGKTEGLKQGLEDEVVWAQFALGYYEHLKTPAGRAAVARLLMHYDVPGTIIVLFCFEPRPLHCHRRLLLEHMQELRPEIVPLHIVGVAKHGAAVFE